MDHSELVAEMPNVERLSVQERLHLARRRRLQQLRSWSQFEKEWLKRRNSQNHNTIRNTANRKIKFNNSVVLLEAAARNDIDEVRYLLKQGVDPDATNEDGLTALHQCCIDDNEKMLLLLLEFGANVNAEDSEKWTPLHAAATCGHLHLVKILVAHNANLLAVNADGNMPYDICEDEPTLDFIEGEMAKQGVTQELIDETRGSTELQMLHELQDIVDKGGDLEMCDEVHGATPLHIAAANGYLQVVDFLLDHHVSTDVKDRDLWQPVHAAACWGHLEVVEALVQAGADLNAKNKHSETPADICEDPEIRERILHLKTEQESKRAQEQQKRRGVRRSQSNNTRTQNVRRTSIRDKSLTSKKEAVAEARLRLQVRDTPITPQSDLPMAYDIPKNGVEPARTEMAAVRRAPEGMDCETNEKENPIALGANCKTDDDAKKINIHVSVTINAGTLADLKKQRAQIRSSSADMSLSSADTHPPSSLSSLSMSRLDEVIGEKPFNRFSGDTSEAICDVSRTSRRCSIL